MPAEGNSAMPGRRHKINEVEELQYFVNELERNLRRLDPQAEISLTDRNR
jgi:hypothetical protein